MIKARRANILIVPAAFLKLLKTKNIFPMTPQEATTELRERQQQTEIEANDRIVYSWNVREHYGKGSHRIPKLPNWNSKRNYGMEFTDFEN